MAVNLWHPVGHGNTLAAKTAARVRRRAFADATASGKNMPPNESWPPHDDIVRAPVPTPRFALDEENPLGDEAAFPSTWQTLEAADDLGDAT